MFPNLFVSPLISQRHMRALESTARATVLPKCHHSGQHTRCVTHWTELELPFCALRRMKIDLYLHIGVRQGSHTNPQTAFGLEHSYNPALAKQCSFFTLWAAFTRLRKSQENPHTQQHRLPIFHHPEIKSWSGISAPASPQIHLT